MKRYATSITLAAVVAATSFAPAARAAAVLEYQWKFDETGTSAPSTVPVTPINLNLVNSSAVATDLHGAAGTGVSGQTADRAFDNSASASTGGNGGLARATSFTNASLGTVSSFTLTTWVNPKNTISGFGRLFILGPGGTTDSGSANTVGLLTSTNPPSSGPGTAPSIEFNIAGFQRTAAYSLPQDVWTFIAISYEDATNTVNFYAGTDASSVTLLKTYTDFTQAAPDLNGTGSTSSAFIGNRDNRGRAFDGLIDDTRFYTGLFADLSEIDAVRTSALPAEIPEPASVGLLALGSLALVARRRKNT